MVMLDVGINWPSGTFYCRNCNAAATWSEEQRSYVHTHNRCDECSLTAALMPLVRNASGDLVSKYQMEYALDTEEAAHRMSVQLRQMRTYLTEPFTDNAVYRELTIRRTALYVEASKIHGEW
jgi:hypothetical protein